MQRVRRRPVQGLWAMAMALAGAGMLGLGSPLASGATPAAPARLADATTVRSLATIEKAMGEADEATLQRIHDENHDSITHIWAVMALERVRFNLDAANRAAQACQDTLSELQPAVALRCGQFQSGNLRLAGQFERAWQLEKTLAQRYAGRGGGAGKGAQAMSAYQRGREQVPRPRIVPPAEPVKLAYVPDHGQILRPVVQAKAAGRSFDLLLDTGASSLTLSEELAKRLGVRLQDRQHHTGGVLSNDVPVREGVLDTLAIGPLVLHDLPVNVIATPDMAILGLSLMTPLGSLRFTRDALYVAAASDTAPTCDSPMRVASDLFGNNLRLVPELPIDGRPRSVLLDTGLSMYLAGSQAIVDDVQLRSRGHLATRDIGGGHAFANVRAAKVNLVISGQPFDVNFPVYVASMPVARGRYCSAPAPCATWTSCWTSATAGSASRCIRT
ncbi:retropepsin-like aspartic protease [Xanthomonas massiliensis]|uniref:retropepsin-like aspartic protease n=1 Tax=Xanthomonas massiliensis TaxID=1720302 RepID=UPI00098E95FB|nr:retropepsin-like aspartic protease [Xanthomonas massiliensis]